ncbi:FRG domain-containing protein [Devosia lacusdianchii]|uniref:FRG domain-containing protein n=1 Tax=Devosia lacusdianchii TaxID=2917991 RepID=UPI001F070EF3|nr:FRG domain-containing protein [Devosia sp. JXJ CY 41]
MWWDPNSAKYTHYFRGHANAAWPLLPKGLRPLGDHNPLTPLYQAFELQFAKYGVPDLLSRDTPSSHHDWLSPFLCWRYALQEAVNQFADLGRQTGLETPRHVHPTNLGRAELPYWPSTPEQPILALAQHHRIPTELLDWSEDPLTAAYFALGAGEDTDLCVWALQAGLSEYYIDGELRILVEKPPTAGNTNIRAQNGVFVRYYGHMTKPSHIFSGSEWLPFEAHDVFADRPTKITLPSSERDGLRGLLLAERRSAAHLMPSWDSVAETLLARWKAGSIVGQTCRCSAAGNKRGMASVHLQK